MFGLMKLETGKVWRSSDPTYHTRLENYVYRMDDGIVAVPKDYINYWDTGHKCQHEGCFVDGTVECHLPDIGYPAPPQETEYYCKEHAYEAGYCPCCGDFWGGIESFDFDNPSHLCENCLDQVKTELDEYEEEEPYIDA